MNIRHSTEIDLICLTKFNSMNKLLDKQLTQFLFEICD